MKAKSVSQDHCILQALNSNLDLSWNTRLLIFAIHFSCFLLTLGSFTLGNKCLPMIAPQHLGSFICSSLHGPLSSTELNTYICVCVYIYIHTHKNIYIYIHSREIVASSSCFYLPEFKKANVLALKSRARVILL